MDRVDVVALLEERGAASIAHPGGTLLAHVGRVAELLASWGAREALVTAGLAHAVYGTDGFAVSLFGLDDRARVASVVGPAAESIVYRYASCDRGSTLGQVGRRHPVVFRDRFTGVDEPLPDDELADFAELTVANEVDLVRQSDEFRAAHGAALATLFSRWQGIVSDAAYAACLHLDPGGASAR
jgi:uncharacterized protein DUF6817